MATPPVAPQLPALTTGATIAPIVPRTLDEAAQIAKIIVQSGMAPRGYDRPEKACVAILCGLEVGLTPMAALQSIAVINGTPALYGDGLLAVVRASGLLEDIKESIELDPAGVPLSATCETKRRGEPTWTKHVFTRADAEKAGLWRKQGPWTQYPGRMLAMRARAWALRDKFADALRGMKMVEEVQDYVDVTAQGSATTAPPPPPKREDYAPKTPAARHGYPSQAVAEAVLAEPIPPHDQETGEIELSLDGNELDPSAPLVFEDYKTIKEFVSFSEFWLEDQSRTPAEARQWEAFYRDKISTMAKHANAKVQEAAAMLIGLYSAVIAREVPQ